MMVRSTDGCRRSRVISVLLCDNIAVLNDLRDMRIALQVGATLRVAPTVAPTIWRLSVSIGGFSCE